LNSTSGFFEVNVTFAADYGGGIFYLYIDHERSSGGANFMVICDNDSVMVYEESATNSGLFNQLKYSSITDTNPPVISGSSYSFSFPLDAIEPTFNPDFSFGYWFYDPITEDRMPDTGEQPYIIIG
jgi:hypothetical protein